MLGRIIPCGWSGARVFTDFQMFQCLIGEDVITEDTWRYLNCICIQHAVQIGMCVQRRFETVCASTQSSQSPSFPHGETMDPWLHIEGPSKTQISLRIRTG